MLEPESFSPQRHKESDKIVFVSVVDFASHLAERSGELATPHLISPHGTAFLRDHSISSDDNAPPSPPFDAYKTVY